MNTLSCLSDVNNNRPCILVGLFTLAFSRHSWLASIRQTICTGVVFIMPLLMLNCLIFYINHGHAIGQASAQAFWLNLSLLNLLIGFFLTQLFYLMCWDHEGRRKRAARQNSQYKH